MYKKVWSIQWYRSTFWARTICQYLWMVCFTLIGPLIVTNYHFHSNPLSSNLNLNSLISLFSVKIIHHEKIKLSKATQGQHYSPIQFSLFLSLSKKKKNPQLPLFPVPLRSHNGKSPYLYTLQPDLACSTKCRPFVVGLPSTTTLNMAGPYPNICLCVM